MNKLVIVIFGASGDLTKRKLMPALYTLYSGGRLPEGFSILGIGRTEYTDARYQEYIMGELGKFVASKEQLEDKMKDFCSHLHYQTLDPAEVEGYHLLDGRLQEFTGEQKPDNLLFYLATPPSLYGVIPLHLKAAGLNRPDTRIIVEKPFGYDLESARKLNSIYASVFKEHQIYRIDHFLGKETAQNILAFRFANGIFEPLWNRNYIDYVEITAVENLGIEGRGGFYEGAGALRDMVQNHRARRFPRADQGLRRAVPHPHRNEADRRTPGSRAHRRAGRLRARIVLRVVDVELLERHDGCRPCTGDFAQSPETGRAVLEAQMLHDVRIRHLCRRPQGVPAPA